MAKQVMDIQNSHGISQGESDENQRRWSDKQWANRLLINDRNYDYTRRNLNFEIVNGKVQKIDTSKTIDQKMREMCAARGMRWPNDPSPRRKPGQDDSKVKERNVAACFIFQGSRERMHEIAFGGYGIVNLERGSDNSHVRRDPAVEQWALDTYNWVGKKFGYENIASFYVHLDETNPHIHCDVLPVAMIKGKERVSYNAVFGAQKKEDLSAKWRGFHDSYYAEVGKKWKLDRGDSIEETGAKHKTYQQWLDEVKANIAKGEKKVKAFTTMVGNLETRKDDLERQIEVLENDLTNFEQNKEELERLRRELEDTSEKLISKQENLIEAKLELDQMIAELESKEETKQQLGNEIENYRQTLQDIKDQIASLSEQERRKETAVKSLTTMISNLNSQADSLRSQIKELESQGNAATASIEELEKELENTELKLKEKKDALATAEKQKQDLDVSIANLKDQEVSLLEGLGHGVGAKLKGWGDSVTRSFSNKDEELKKAGKEEGKKETMDTMLAISGGWIDKVTKKPKVPTPKEYAENYKAYREKAEKVDSAEEKNKQLIKENNTLKEEKEKAVEEAESRGRAAGQRRADTILNVLRGMWPTSEAAIKAILEKTENPSSKRFTVAQAESVFKALEGSDPDDRDQAAQDLITLADADYSGNPKWLDDTAEEVLTIAGNFTQLAVLFAIPAQGGGVSSGGGGGGGNNDLPKKRDDEWNRRVNALLQPGPAPKFRRKK